MRATKTVNRNKTIWLLQVCYSLVCKHSAASDMVPVSSKEFLDIQATVECGFTLTLVHDMIKTYNQMHRTDKYSQHSSIIWPVWLNG